jgi:hypothetical protein
MCVCVRAFFCVYVEALWRADHPSKKSYRLWMIKKLRNQLHAPKWEQEEEKNTWLAGCTYKTAKISCILIV